MVQVVYVYEGRGALRLARQLLISSLRRCLCPRSYSIKLISPQQIQSDDWQESCAALVLGGGYDKGYLTALGVKGAASIRRFVLQGGTYIGFCSGAYFACDYIEFEKGSPLEVSGERPLKFFPGKSLGCIAPNFKYGSERGAAALPLSVPAGLLPGLSRGCILHAYINGGGFFSPYSSLDKTPHVKSVETLASFDSFEGQPAAVVKCSVGEKGGVAILSHPHLEFAAFELDPTDEYLMNIQTDLRISDRRREQMFMMFLEQGNLRVNKVKAAL